MIHVRLFLVLLGLVLGGPVAAAEDELLVGPAGGEKIAVHHVRLTGHSGDNESDRKHLIEFREACEGLNRDMGKPVAPLPAAGYPDVIKPLELDVYYASNRIFRVTRTELYSVEVEDCSIARQEGEEIQVFSRAGMCRITLRKKRAGGQCDLAAHARAAPIRAGEIPRTYQQALDIGLSRMPPEQRRKFEAGARAAGQQVQNPPGTGPTSEFRTIAGLSCRVHRETLWNGERCIADPTPESVPGLDPYPIMAAAETLFFGGITLEARSQVLSLKAERVELSTQVPASLFEIPAGFKVNSLPPLSTR